LPFWLSDIRFSSSADFSISVAAFSISGEAVQRWALRVASGGFLFDRIERRLDDDIDLSTLL
jgi:hypothetical protein